VGGFGKLGGDALYAMGKGSDIINETFGVKDREKGDSVFAKGAEVLLTDAENRQNAHPHIKVTDIKGFGDLGGWAGQTLGAIAPFAVGMAIGSTEASLASKAFLTASPGLMGFSLGAAGGAMSDMDKEMANTPGLDYSNWQYMAKTAGSVGSNALMFGNYAAIFKGNKALFESIGKTPAATVEFKKGFQDYAGDLFTVAKGSNKTGATMALVSGINMFVDNHVLGKKHEGSFEEIADSYVEGVAMHIGTAEAPKALVFMAEKLLPSPTKKAIRSNLGTIHTLMKEINNPNLTPQERTIVKNKIFEAHKENTALLNKSLKDAGKLTGPQVNELLIADQNRFDITKKVEEVKKGNFSDEYKKSELNKLKTEFKALDSRTTNVFSDPFNAINILPDAAKRKTEAQRELIKEFNDKNPESNKKIVLEDNEINERALKNYSKELKDEKAAKLEVEKEQAPIVETPVVETPKAEEVVTPEVVAENVEGQGVSKEVVAPSVEDIEKRRQDDIKKYDERDARSLDAITPNNPNHTTFKVGMKRNSGDNVLVVKTNADNWNGEGEGYTVITAVKSPAEFDSNGKMTKAAKIEEAIFNTKEEADAYVQATFEKVKSLTGRKQQEINAKYDAELEALKNESTPQTNPPTNGDVQPGVQPVGESGVAKPETPAKEGIPSPVDGGKSKGDASIGEKVEVFHGTSRTFSNFDIEATNSGQGDAAHGFGIYFSDSQNVAKYFSELTPKGYSSKKIDFSKNESLKNVLNKLKDYVGEETDALRLYNIVMKIEQEGNYGDYKVSKKEINETLDILDSNIETKNNDFNPNVKKVTIDTRSFLHKDSVLKNEELIDILNKINKITKGEGNKVFIENIISKVESSKTNDKSAIEVYKTYLKDISEKIYGKGDKYTSNMLSEIGIGGFVYGKDIVLDEGNKNNYVVFDPKLITTETPQTKSKGDVEIENKKVASPKKEINLEDVSSFLDQEFGSKKPAEAKEAPKQEKKTESVDVAEVKGEVAPVKEVPKTKKETTSTKYVEKPVNEIKTDENRFQNRTELDEEQLKSIKDNWNENELDPVVIWKDKDGNDFILAGHHRLEASKQLGKEAIDARYFKGTEAEAIKYATEKSNANRTMEQSYDRAKKLRQLRESGASKKDIAEFAKGDGKNKKFVENLSHLNPKGKIMDMLKSFGKAGDKETIRLTESAADWIGESRKHYPEFSDAHENELFDYLINKGNLKKIGNKTEFTTRLQKYADAVRLFPDEPLNIEHRGVKGDLEQSKAKEIDVVKADIKTLEKERDKGTPTEARLKDITKLIEIKNAELGKLNKQLSEAKAGDKVQGDLFDVALNDVVVKINEKQITDEQANEFINGENKPNEAIIADIKGKAKNAERISKKELEKGIAEADALLGKEKVESNPEAKKISDQVRKLKVDLSKLSDGGLQSNPLGIPVALWNTSIEIIAKSIDAGVAISEAIKRGLDHIQKNHSDALDKKEFEKNILAELGNLGVILKDNQVLLKDNVNLELSKNKIRGKLLNESKATELQTEIENNYTGNSTEMFNGKKDDIRLNAFNYDNPVLEMTSNGVNLRVASGLIRTNENGFREKTWLLYADGKVAGEFYSVKDIKTVISYIEQNLIKPLAIEQGKLSPKEQQKAILKAEVDKIAQQAKDWLPGVKDPNLKKQGIGQDQLIDLVAAAVKKLIDAGVEIDAAIKQVVDAVKTKFGEDLGFDIEHNLVKDKMFPKKEKDVLFVDDEGNKYTSLKNRIVEPEREAQGKETVKFKNNRTTAERQQDTFEEIKSGKISNEEVRDIVTSLAKGEDIAINDSYSREKLMHIVMYDKIRLENEAERINKTLDSTDPNAEEYGTHLLELARNEMLEEENHYAGARVRSNWGAEGQTLQLENRNDFSRPAIIKKLEDASKNNELSPEFRKKSGEIAREIKDLQDKQEEHNTKYEELDAKYKDKESENEDLKEKISKYEAEKKLEKAVKLQGLKDKKEYKIADIEKKQKVVIDRLREKYKNLSGMVNAGINPKFLELAPDVAILAKYEIQKGAVKLEEVIGRVHLQLKDIIPELTERDVRDLFSGYGKSVIPKDVSANEQTLRDLRAKARALSGLQDVKEEGTAPLRSGFRHTEPTEEVKALRREIHREMRARGIDIKNAKDPQAVWKTAIESYKTRTNNRIEYLESIAKSKDVEKYLREKKKTKMKLDDEGRQLKVKSQKAKHVVDDMVSSLDFETWSKFRKTRHYEIRRARGTLISQPVTLAKIAGAVAWRTAFKIPTAVATYGMSKLKPGIAKVEGINSVKDLTQHIVDYYKTEFSMKNAKESYKTYKNHASTEEILFGKHHGRVPLPKIIGNKELSLRQKISLGHIKFLEDISAASHGGLKNLVALPEYEAYKNTIMRNLIKNGIPEDMMNDGSMEQIAHQLAYAKSQRARFGQDNAVASLKTNVEKILRNKEHHLTADVLDAAMPIVKIASNYIGESFEKYPFIGMAANGKYLLKPSKVLTTKQQGNLLRTLAHQGVGAMQMMLGAMMYKSISAFYGTDADEYAKEQNPDLAKHDGALGVLSHMFAHSPDAEAMRLGASFMWYWEMYDKKNNADKSIMSDFMIATMQNTGALINQSPYFSASESIIAPFLDSGFSMDSGGKAVVNIIRPRVQFMDAANTVAQGKIPQLEKLAPELAGKISNKLGMIPETVKPYEVNIRAKGFIDNLKMGSPWHRNDLLNKMIEESKMPKLKTPETYVKRKENEYNKIKNEVQFRKEHPKKKS
jgi:hypothetical protein